MEQQASPRVRDPVDQLIFSSREMRRHERYVEALAAIGRARSMTPTGEQLRHLDAEEARLSYYLGLFAHGCELAVRILGGPPDMASASALVARSVNALALNQANEALASVNDALLRLKILRAAGESVVDAQIQLTHVLANMGRHAEATANARACLRVARETAEDESPRAEYALGFALAYAGDDEAIDRLLGAEVATRRNSGALWNWIVFCLAAYLRDRGFLEGAADFLGRTSVALRHERAWFAYRSGDMAAALTWLRPPIRPDERPFTRTVIGAVRLHRRESRRVRTCAAAAREFGETGLDHWRWGATWIDLAMVRATNGLSLRSLLDELATRGVSNWGFYDPIMTERILRRSAHELRGSELAARLLTRATRSGTVRADLSVLLEALHLLNPESLLALTEAGLTASEIRTLLRAMQVWLHTGATPRRVLANALGLQESSVRVQLGRIRAKLGIQGRRGFEPLLLWLAERDLLSPSTATAALKLLAAR